ncbi:MAG: hypothetical protein IPL56_07890 [Saprospiraceae bacterium]|jgi:hypothetical protein|nr:hypothetical protein [Saprospiraceae bacterium]MBK7437788.1 hypothetical protein [Saprospiraceae bacterium]MBK8512164.1 hypothetical protein [Saprospiraceae bacterium]
MALFDFPRINFNGRVDVNVPTINNAVYYPLTMYDATHSQAFLPPRIYYDSQADITKINSSFAPTIHTDPQNHSQPFYIEIEPINDIPSLQSWCMTPLGQGEADAAYLPYYQSVTSALGPIVGLCPGYWNMWGDMGVTLSNTEVTGVQTFDGTVITLYDDKSSYIPPEVAPLLSAKFDFDATPGSGKTTALMVETVSNQSCYASIFCSNLNLYNSANPAEVYLQGTPFKFSASIYSAWRTVNWWPAMGGSARFCSALPLDQIPAGQNSPVVQFFNKYIAYDGRPLKGLFISFTIQSVFENRYDQNYYKEKGTQSNPARGYTVGSITPWYDGDLISSNIGRNLISLNAQPIFQNLGAGANNPVPVSMTPAICSIKSIGTGVSVLSLDMGNSWPEAISPAYSQVPPIFQPPMPENATFETAVLGKLTLGTVEDASLAIATIDIDPLANPRLEVYKKGAIFDFIISDQNISNRVHKNFLKATLTTPQGYSILALEEATYMFASDQKGLYTDQGDTPGQGFNVFSNTRESFVLRIFQKGARVTDPIPVGIAQYIIPDAANDPPGLPNKTVWLQLADGAVIDFSQAPFGIDNNAVYYFVYDGLYPKNQVPVFSPANYTVMDTGYFTVMRVHPSTDYSRYLDKNHPSYAPPDFEVIYNEIFKLYDVVYPIMGKALPFNKAVWDDPTIAGLVLERTDLKNWNNIIYMPRSRELSADQRALIVAWANNISSNRTT